jgi:DNA polymerase
MDDLKMVTVPTEEQLKKFPGMVALQVVYENHVHDCTKCELHEKRTKIVFGTGIEATEEPPVAFVGEGPGKNEDEQGVPFVGDAGKLLDAMIDAMGYKRSQVYILNAVCCRPPKNRNPSSDELEACWPIMASQLKAVRPKTIVCLGAVAAKSLLRVKIPIMDELRRRWHSWEGVPVRVTYHPSYLLRQPDKKTRAWSDLQAVMEKINEPKHAF